MITPSKISEYAVSIQAKQAASGWISEEEQSRVDGDYHCALLTWVFLKPEYALAVIINVIDLCEAHSMHKVVESLCLGPLELLLEKYESAVGDFRQWAIINLDENHTFLKIISQKSH